MDESTTDLLRAATAVALGSIVGLQREFSYRQQQSDPRLARDDASSGDIELFAGTRTFALLALAGWLCAETARLFDDSNAVLVGLLVVGALLATAHVLDRGQHGLTTEIAALATFLLGVLCHAAPIVLPIALAVVISVLLGIKLYTRSLVRALAPDDVMATLKFAVMTAIVLPVLPRTAVLPPPFDVWVPYDIWLMAVLIAAIGFAGYVLHKLLGPRHGTALAGLLGGLVSSTAATLGLARAAATRSAHARFVFGAIVLAWSTMFLRVGVAVFVVQRELLVQLWPALVMPLLVAAPFVFFALRDNVNRDTDGEAGPALENPFELLPALGFAVAYAAVLLLARLAFDVAGDAGVYVVSFLSGVVDVDAITLSLAGGSASAVAESGRVPPDLAARGIALALLANTLVKAVLAAVIGGKALRAHALRAGGAIAGALVLVFVFA